MFLFDQITLGLRAVGPFAEEREFQLRESRERLWGSVSNGRASSASILHPSFAAHNNRVWMIYAELEIPAASRVPTTIGSALYYCRKDWPSLKFTIDTMMRLCDEVNSNGEIYLHNKRRSLIIGREGRPSAWQDIVNGICPAGQNWAESIGRQFFFKSAPAMKTAAGA